MKIRYLLVEARRNKNLSARAAAKLCKLNNHSSLLALENCLNDGLLETWKNIQKAYGIKDKDMWLIMTSTKYVENPHNKK